jgi:predicted nucleic acid-binding protein
MILADTGYFIALLNPRDALHARAQKWAASVDESLLVTEPVVWETINFFSAPVNRPKVHSFLVRLFASGGCEFLHSSPKLFEKGLTLHGQRQDKEWSLTDCISFVVMEERSLTRALTYDHHFEQAGFTALLRQDP